MLANMCGYFNPVFSVYLLSQNLDCLSQLSTSQNCFSHNFIKAFTTLGPWENSNLVCCAMIEKPMEDLYSSLAADVLNLLISYLWWA